ncbi:hypothetical protein AOL_s00004g631 [Orbilia oligospora ATCC 24927]|uniref:Uncharacterized protein n=1 Tax=Arthrobotrys oligospora (strain ATCC 24927 / CBS 115.81 / DSM 1491) TaxID=756982 RepID=G1WZC0_ARTOA|nr:hypothetical protein AOL_s00004g631 [Orbilia oligospora ATCC 24927]EGX53972.1 hypothetical protein AOL_s00004g631 [Orbilia oligospora ATCC 24927]
MFAPFVVEMIAGQGNLSGLNTTVWAAGSDSWVSMMQDKGTNSTDHAVGIESRSLTGVPNVAVVASAGRYHVGEQRNGNVE